MPECNNGSIWKGRLLCSSQLAKRHRLTQSKGSVPFLSKSLNQLSVWRSCNILQAKSLGKGAGDNSGMIHPESSHEVMILHINKTLGLDLLEIDSKIELPCNQVNVQGTNCWKIWFSGIQSYCPSNLKYGKKGYPSLYHPGKGAHTIEAVDIQI